MKKVFSILFAMVLVVGLTFVACDTDDNGNGNEIIVQAWDPAVHGEVEFYQLQWMMWGEGEPVPLHPFSNVGTVKFFFAEGAGEWLLDENGGAWLHVVTNTTAHGGSAQWAVQNLYLVYPDPSHLLGSAPSVQFSLGLDGEIPLPGLEAAVFLSSAPLTAQPEVDEFIDYGVVLKPYLTGGRLDQGGGSASSDIPTTIGDWVGPLSPPDRTASILTPTASIAAIDEGHQGCAPGSAARSIDYLGQNNDFETADPQGIYDDLVEAMETDICGSGTADDDMLEGKNSYSGANELPINSHISYTDTYEPTEGSSWSDLMKEVQDALEAGCDVEILIGWSGGGGHAAMVTGVTVHEDGSATITYVDDPNQGDGVAENEEHVITTDASGEFGTGTVDGFMIECVAS